MPILVDIDVMLAKRKMSVGVLTERVGITPANLAVLKTGVPRRFASRRSPHWRGARVPARRPDALGARGPHGRVRAWNTDDHMERGSVRREARSLVMEYLVAS